MAVQIKKGTALASLSITPLIDIVFLLLIFFLVASRFAEEDRELEVKLPSASQAMPMTAQPREIFVNIDQHDRYHMGRQQCDEPELEQMLRDAVRNNPLNQTVRIRADRRSSWNAVARAIDVCHRAGIHGDNIVIPTEGEQPPPAAGE